MAVTIIPLSGGTSMDPEADVRFFDPYDGTLVATYSAADFANLDALPDNPTHDGMISQGWNWTLADAKEQVAWCGFLDIGQQYLTSDGKTRVYVHMVTGLLEPKMKLSIKGTVTVDWGDGSSEAQTNSGSSFSDKTWTHTYASAGDYVVTIAVSGGSYRILSDSYSSCLFSALYNANSYNYKYSNCVRRVELGSNVILYGASMEQMLNLEYVTIPTDTVFYSNYQFYNCVSLKCACIPSGVTSGGSNTFQNCAQLRMLSVPKSLVTIGSHFAENTALKCLSIPKAASSIGSYLFDKCVSLERYTIPTGITTLSMQYLSNTYLVSVTVPSNITEIGQSAVGSCRVLRSVTLPNGLTTLGSNAFSGDYSLQEITLPSTLTSIGSSAFTGCYALGHITIPASVTSIGSSAFSSCAGLGEIRFAGSTPPSVGSSAWANVPNTCKIYVPSGSLSAYTSTSGMPSSSTYTYVEY
jgi:hypothetical protein